MDKPRKTAKQLLDMKKQAGFFSVSANSTVKAALDVLSEKNIGAVLVMEGTKLVGIFSERDYARKGELQGRTAGSTAIREVMTSNIASVTPDQMVEQCRRIMGERRIRHLPVVSGETLVGIVSERDLFRSSLAQALGYGNKDTREVMKTLHIKDVMVKQVTTVSPDTELKDAVALMAERKIGCLPVVQDDKLLGLITETDVLMQYCRDLGGCPKRVL